MKTGNCMVCEAPLPRTSSMVCPTPECRKASWYMNAASASRKGTDQKRYFETEAVVLVAAALVARDCKVRRFDVLVAARQCPWCNGKLLGPTEQDTVFCKLCSAEFRVT